MIQTIEANLHTNWQKELAMVVTDPIKLLKMLELDEKSFSDDIKAKKLFPMRVPIPFIKKIKKGDPQDPLLLQVMPLQKEFLTKKGFDFDPLLEQKNEVPGLLHKYKSRVLIIFKTGCAVNCRYCFRRHFPYQDNHLNKRDLLKSLKYIENDLNINEVILSGGDPLMAKDEAIDWFITELEKIKHVSRLRVHTRFPVVIPSRITTALCERFSNSKLKIIIVMHINHANEIDKVLINKMKLLKSSGVTLLNQAVLLKGVNDTSKDLVNLSEKLFSADILPYYLHLLDKVSGASHFDVSEEKSKQLMLDILSELPGFLVPKLVREIGGEKNKTPINLIVN
ncbi:EF-P beta-lysylation protein EpmB [Pseudoalteromonas denitrificans]|uniref:L-lysine 2,3-aminomutase n=1 Tax=Pseudoalteromonas denitrificans DSM 6059 TaxID=1123010 RepID=A0A1I1JB97_9GAMM|nr:EF-P beta-lysylation protein EpmB [Pseudoalteromonas denitrificans]SFC45391.1 EF-P beta-lysylation protein EpmB [Pseudoalteromonas denitrificans DSM 6059]